MEENTFLDYNPQFNNPIPNNMGNSSYIQARNSGIEDGAIKRWAYPGLAEAAQFDRENFMMDKENAFNEYMYNKANEYNSPAAQMERAREAGINPNLAAAGIMGQGNATALPMNGAKGDVGMNTNATNPIENLGTAVNAIATGVGATKDLGELFGFGEKNNAEIKLIKNNAKKVAEEMKYTRRQRIQLENIGDILVNNAKLEGNQIEQNIKNLKELNDLYKKQQDETEAHTNLLKAQEGTEIQNKRSVQLDNFKKEFEKELREMLGIEVTHSEMAMLVEAFLNGHGEQIINYFIDTMAGAGKSIREFLKNLFTDDEEENNDEKPKTEKTPEKKHEIKNKKMTIKAAQRIWINNRELRFKYKGNFDEWLQDFEKEMQNDTLYKENKEMIKGWFGDLK